MEIGLYFGSFNPIHIGHLIIAQHLAANTPLQQIWFVVSPHNPLKDKASLLNQYDRLHLVELAIDGNDAFRASNIEFLLPQPSYTIDTMAYLEEKYPSHSFSLIMGSDSLATLPKWKHYQLLVERYQIYVYQRPDTAVHLPEGLPSTLHLLDNVPQLLISASFIRQQIKAGKQVKYLLPTAVENYIEKMGLYLQ
jgi:nicotinate-nucleotide adenylyltransferase